MPAGRFPTPTGNAARQRALLTPGQTLRFDPSRGAGKGYYAAGGTRAPAAAPASDPFALATPQQIQQQIQAYTGGMPAVLTDPQLAARAQAQVDPLIAALSARIGDRAKQGAASIAGYTGTLQKDLGQYAGSARNIYGQAEQGQAQSDAALASMLAGHGTDEAAALAAKLGGAGMSQGAIDATAGQQATVGQGSAGAQYAQGSASLSDLIARGAGAQDYAAKQPGIAGLGGLQQIGQLQRGAQNDLADQSAQVQQQIPGIIASLRADNQTALTNRTTGAQSLRQYLQGRNDTLAANNRSRADKLTADALYRSDTLALGAGKNATAAAQDAKPNATLSRAVGYQVDSNGAMIPDANGNPQILPGFKVGADGSVVKAVAPKTPKTPADKTAATAKARTTAVTQASTNAIGIFGKESTVTGTNPATGEKHRIHVKIGSPAYNESIHRAVAAVSDTLSPYMTPAQIMAYVQAKAKAFYAPADKQPPNVNPATNPNAAGPPAP
jgi:hypothetical protein